MELDYFGPYISFGMTVFNLAGPQSYLPLSVESFVKGLHIIQIGASDFSHAYMNLKMNTEQIRGYLPGVANSISTAVKVIYLVSGEGREKTQIDTMLAYLPITDFSDQGKLMVSSTYLHLFW